MATARHSAPRFEAWFEKATGCPPFPYQIALATDEELPHLLHAATGAGKTAAAVLGWLWRRREAPAEVRARTPRRLVFCLPMRTLVDQTAGAASTWIARLGLEAEVSVHGLLGGAVDERWEAHPERDVILVGTQDQLLSRALFRGYSMSRYRWPIHFALLNSDCLWVLDEVQLMGVGVTTSAQLEAFRASLGVALPTRSLWMSATLDEALLGTVDLAGRLPALRRLRLEKADRAAPALERRLSAPKPLERGTPKLEAKTKPAAYAVEVAKTALEAHVDGTLTLIVLNRVARAQAVFAALAKAKGAPALALIHSRFRPADRQRIQADALTPGWSGILVATQAIEAGVDISARTLLTELAPWPSLVQRFGRCNRQGELAKREARVLWLDIAEEDHAAPYEPEALASARRKLKRLEDVGPRSLSGVEEEPGQVALPVVRERDLRQLFDTQADLLGHDVDVSRFVRASNDRDAQVAWRSWEGDEPGPDLPALHRDELVTVPVHALDKLIERHRGSAYRWNGLEARWDRVRKAAPGQAILLDAAVGGYDPALGWTGSSDGAVPVVAVPAVPADADEAEWLSWACADFVSLSQHSQDVVEELQRLADLLGDAAPWDDLERAARWHDLGKAHAAFQAMLVSSLPPEDHRRRGGPWAKSDGRPGERNRRRHFRHELASALALLDQGGSDLQAYLVAAHHGKVRMSIRSRPEEPEAPEGRRFALGVWDDDMLPEVDLGAGVRSAEVRLSLELMELGDGSKGPSWSARTSRLLESVGPFRLAYWEMLVRVADWRGTARRQGQSAALTQGG